MTPCPNCGWPHHSPITLVIPCGKCSTPVRVVGKDPEAKPVPLPRTKEQQDSRLIGWVKLFRKPEDRGVGDTVERLLAVAGGRKIKRMLERVGINCGCTDRQKALNEQHPYPER
jgi:hypothetical protein